MSDSVPDFGLTEIREARTHQKEPSGLGGPVF